MTISDALPIQFWYNGVLTYNEYDPGMPFVHHLFYQEFLNTDDQKVQIRDTTGLTYNLQFFDCDGNETDLLPMPEITTGVYEVTFNPGDMGIVNEKRQLKIQKGTVIGTITTETQVSIDEFVSTMDGWVNVDTPSTTLAAINTFVNSGLGSRDWVLTSGFPKTSAGLAGAFSRLACISFVTSQGFSYNVQTQFDVYTSAAGHDCQIYVAILDSSFNIITQDVFSFTSVGGTETKTINSRLFSSSASSYLGVRFLDSYTFSASECTWKSAVYTPDIVANWAQSSDDGGCLKVTTVATEDTSIITKSVTLPQQNHYVRIKWQIVYPAINSNFSLVFRILDNLGNAIFAEVFMSPSDNSEQIFNQFITSSIYLTAAKFRIDINDSSGIFVSGDIAKINSVEIYTSVTNNIVEFTEMAKSDYVSFPNLIDSAIYLQYKSSKNFAGIYYTTLSPYFSIRIPGLFQKEKLITEQKSIDLSNSRVINTASQLKVQKMFRIFECPDYMHKKIILILQHAISGSVVINNVEWTMEESYEQEDVDPLFIFSKASTLLTRRNYLEGNVI